ncbi:A.superbus venom factor 1-like [Anomaloglossus baeobatrachus]
MGCRVLCLILLALLAACLGQKCLLITPNILRLESEETIVVDGLDKAFEAFVEIYDFPKRSLSLASQRISLSNGNNFLGTATVKIPANELTKDPQKYVYVTVKSPVCNMEKVVLLSYQSGYVFFQTDKAIYAPGSTVLYRIFSMDHKMSPLNTNLIIEFLTPDNVIVNKYVTNTGASGISSLSFRLPELPSLGVWTISAKYEDSSVQISTANFEVKEFVPPSYEITLTPQKKYFYVDDSELSVDIEAKFLHGGPLNGMAFVIFGVKKDDVKTPLPNTLRRIVISDGEGVVVLLRRDLVGYLKNDAEMLQHTLYMSVTVITPAGSEIVKSELEDITIVKSPYIVLFTKTAKYYKPGMPYDLKLFVTNPDGSPARNVPVVAEPGRVQSKTGEEGTVRLTLNTPLHLNPFTIIVSTADPALPNVRQATASMTANAYQSDGNYLYIGASSMEVTPGDTLIVNFNIRNSNSAVQNQIQHFTYLITSKGRILKVSRQPRMQNQYLVTMSLPISEEFIPSFRIIAYYNVGNEIVSDSISVDVKDSERCIGTLLVTGNNNRDNEIQSPGASMRLKIQADPNAYVGLVAVDKGLNMLNRKFKMSQKKVWDTMEKSDTGCTPGSGANSMGVFYDAGLALQSSFQKTTQERSEPQCKVRAVRKRRSKKREPGADEVYDEYLPDSDIVSRTQFQESWFWRLEQMTERPDNKGISTKILNVFLKDSITTWEVLAVSLSPNKGFCVAKPYEIKVKTRMFIDLKLPYSVVEHEQVEIRAVLYNYGYDKIKVRVDLIHNPEICSLSTARRNYRQIVAIAPQSSVSVPFTLVPLSLGYHDVQVKASIFGQFESDGVKKKLKVVAPLDYSVLMAQKEKKCNNFDVSVTVKDEPNVRSPEGALSTVSVEICARHLKGSDATMSVLDVSMMTGFAPDIESLNKLKKGVDKFISKFEINRESTDKGSLIIYLDKISHREDDCIKFNVHQVFKVGLIQPASVTVYDYSSPENRCTKIYHVDQESKLLGKICQNNVCRCAEGNCFLQQQLEDKMNAYIRFERACAPGVDYVYKTRLEEIQSSDNYDNYVMKIISVIKGGTEKRVLDNQRNFISHVKCRKALNLKTGHDYLIWGVSEDLWQQPSGYAYIIGKNTWIEQWPNERECQKAEFTELCDELNQFYEELELGGCRT